MRYWKKTISILFLVALPAFGACAREDAHASANLAIHGVTIEHGVLTAELDWQPSATLLDALDHGIALDFAITLGAQTPSWLGFDTTIAQTRWQRELRYFPLTRQYQLRDPANTANANTTRSFATRALVLAALSNLRLPLSADFPADAGQTLRLSIDLERDRLPGALRLPALLNADWRAASASYTWHPASG